MSTSGPRLRAIQSRNTSCGRAVAKCKDGRGRGRRRGFSCSSSHGRISHDEAGRRDEQQVGRRGARSHARRMQSGRWLLGCAGLLGHTYLGGRGDGPMAGRRARLTLELAPLLHQCVLHAAGWSRAEFSLVGNLSATRGAHDSTQPLLRLLLAAVLPGRTGAWGAGGRLRAARLIRCPSALLLLAAGVGL